MPSHDDLFSYFDLSLKLQKTSTHLIEREGVSKHWFCFVFELLNLLEKYWQNVISHFNGDVQSFFKLANTQKQSSPTP